MANDIETLFGQTLDASDLSDKQKSVLRASLILFADTGFDRTSTRDIAKAANVSEGTVYKHFKTKEQILDALMGPFIEGVLPKAANQFLGELSEKSGNDFERFLYYALKNRMEFATKNAPEAKIFIREVMHRPELTAQILAKFDAVLKSQLIDLIRAYQDKGQLVNWEPLRIIRYIIGTMMSYLIPSIIFGDGSLNIEETAREATEFLIKGLRPYDLN